LFPKVGEFREPRRVDVETGLLSAVSEQVPTDTNYGDVCGNVVKKEMIGGENGLGVKCDTWFGVEKDANGATLTTWPCWLIGGCLLHTEPWRCVFRNLNVQNG
jgi:hypothetical protein